LWADAAINDSRSQHVLGIRFLQAAYPIASPPNGTPQGSRINTTEQSSAFSRIERNYAP
jgi:hypothetical protein